MKRIGFERSQRNCFAARPLVSLVLAVALFAVSLPATISAQTLAKTPRLTEDQRLLHVLNRLGYGARPGDVERVRRVGLERYIEQQLFPDKIADETAAAKVRDLPAMQMTTAELYAKYPQPGALLKQLQRQGRLPAGLAELRENRVKGNPPAGGAAAMPAAAGEQADDSVMSGEVMPQSMKNDDAAKQPEAEKNADRNEYREAIRQYYVENNLLPPHRLTADLQASRILRAVYSERQLQEVLVDFWSNHFNVFAGKGADRWLLVSFDRDTIRPHTLGKFRDLLQATAESPAMLFYLDNFQSVSPNAAPQGGMNRGGMMNNRRRMNRGGMRPGGGLGGLLGGGGRGAMRDQQQRQPADNGQMNMPPRPPRRARGINENYARELMELHTLGVEGGYTQKDVQEVARCFTGWTIMDPRGFVSAMGLGNASRAGSFYFNARQHDDGEKTVLGHKIPAGGGVKDGLMVLDILARHPATAKFIATKLARRFVSDAPTPALVERIAAAFTKSDGDIRETLRAVFTSPEFNAPENYRQKIKTPFEVAMSAVRSLGGETNGGPALHQWIARMGEPLYMYQAPTGYPDTAEHWVNTGALLERLNFGLALAANRIPGTRVDLARHAAAGGANNGGGTATAADKSRLVGQFAAIILQGDISPKTKESLLRQLNEAATTATTATTAQNADTLAPAAMGGEDSLMELPAEREPRGRRRAERMGAMQTPVQSEVARVAALILGSPEFQRQ
ncbi:MAG: DUF1800 domain-containing protein [Pyrinomonadaceae bacterium]|nr:DUF1800 domain-containing protein [Pyrinomonadaceae bacterium]